MASNMGSVPEQVSQINESSETRTVLGGSQCKSERKKAKDERETKGDKTN